MKLEKATFAGGCFWCTEAIFQQIKGVVRVVSGYAGGKLEKPSYEAVSTGNTGHAEAVQITFNPQIVSYNDLLYLFWRTHDPTTLNRQGEDVGPQYSSVIFYADERERRTALKSLKEAQKLYDDPIVTEILPFKNFYQAEDYHQNYYSNNKTKSYCKLIIDPKLTKLKRDYGRFIKKS